jgi:hypothetical protein
VHRRRALRQGRRVSRAGQPVPGGNDGVEPGAARRSCSTRTRSRRWCSSATCSCEEVADAAGRRADEPWRRRHATSNAF